MNITGNEPRLSGIYVPRYKETRSNNERLNWNGDPNGAWFNPVAFELLRVAIDETDVYMWKYQPTSRATLRGDWLKADVLFAYGLEDNQIAKAVLDALWELETSQNQGHNTTENAIDTLCKFDYVTHNYVRQEQLPEDWRD